MPHRLDIKRRLHERLLEIVGSALPLIPSSMRDADLAGLAHLRTEMVEAIDAYCRHVHQARDESPGGATAEFLVAGCTDLKAAYERFRDRWAHREAVGNWHEYRLSAVVMMKQVRNQVLAAESARADRLAVAA